MSTEPRHDASNKSADTAPPPGTDAPGKVAPVTDASPQDDDADLDLLSGNVEGTGDEPTEAIESSDADTDRPAWQRPTDAAGKPLEDDALVEWKEQQDLPVDADDYEVTLDLKEGETISETGQQLIDALKGFAVENDMPAPTVNGLVNWYNEQIAAHHAKLAEGDKAQQKEATASLTELWGDQYAGNVKIVRQAAKKSLPPPLLKALQVARTPDGRKLAAMPELAQFLLNVGSKGKATNMHDATVDDQRVEEQARLIMRTDFPRYINEGWDKKLSAVEARKAGPPTESPPSKRERELTALLKTNAAKYFATGGSTELAELRRARAAADK